MTKKMEELKKAEKEAEELVKQLSSKDTPPADEDPPETPAPSAGDAPAPETPTKEPEPNWKERFEARQGKYNAEVPRLAGEIRQMKDDLRAANARGDSLQQQLDAAKTAPAPAAPAPASHDLDQEMLDRVEEEYGKDFMTVVRAVAGPLAREMASSAIADFKREQQHSVSELSGKVEVIEKREAKTALERFWADIESAVSNWSEVNNNPAFHAWLDEVDPLTGSKRQSYLSHAQKTLDAGRVISIFRAFLSTQKPAAPETPPAPQQPQRPVAPGKGSAGDPPAPAKVYTVADWNKLQNDYMRGEYRGREAEYKKLEREIHAALTGGGKAA